MKVIIILLLLAFVNLEALTFKVKTLNTKTKEEKVYVPDMGKEFRVPLEGSSWNCTTHPRTPSQVIKEHERIFGKKGNSENSNFEGISSGLVCQVEDKNRIYVSFSCSSKDSSLTGIYDTKTSYSVYLYCE